MRLTLRIKFLLLVTGVVAGMTCLVLLITGLLIGQEISRSVHGSVSATGVVLEQFLRERSDTLRVECLTFARQPIFKAYMGVSDSTLSSAASRPDSATIVDSLSEYLKEMKVAGALITDRDGLTLGETEAHHQERGAHSRDTGVAAALLGNTWSGVQAYHGKLMLTVSVPVLIHNEVWGTFTAYSPIDSDVAAELKKALGCEVAFLHDGAVVGASRTLHTRLPIPQKEPQLVNVDGSRYFALYAPLPDTRAQDSMGFIVLTPYAHAMDLYKRFQFALLSVAVVSLLLAPLVGFSVARSITRPLDGVVRAAQQLQNGVWPEAFQVRRNDEIGLLQTVFNEMTAAMHANQERLLALIDTDPLTEVENHRRFQERVVQETKRALASGETLCLLLINIDQFHAYNQKYGHVAGDQALIKTALVLKNTLPELAAVSRYGGDEFAVLLPRQSLEEAEQSAERIRAILEKQGHAGQGEEGFCVSVGCAEFGTHTTQAEGLVMAAELAVAQAKQLGRNRVCRFDALAANDETADPYQLHKLHKDGSLATIQALAAAVDAKDPYTRGHSNRVADYAVRLAEAIGMNAAEVELIYITGTLHDVGKIGVPDAILKKPGRLTDEERVIMETHPAMGEMIVRKAPQLNNTLPGVRHHHERWDGKGYPDALAAEEIPLMARILAVADTYDAMTSDRPYRKGLAVEIALQEIEKGAGTQFDPALAPAFVAMMQAASPLEKAA